ncbi:excinuclease ABC subunit UvrA [Candidatus Woesebacteria bacterium]|nr:excinuclease ABC subunit UvrA [Candidatus Woesebacteria bacterium]QQG47178.1 MAG: excinuclease ABC subunit UvrA [Candidatus Woesebacteria bacterium]
MENYIKVRGAREHNLKNIDLDIPKNKLVVFTGVSGSGKSSLAFDTIYAEGQRRYVESLSSYARQFLGVMQKPDVDSIEGLSPAISIDQKTTSKNPRSTVGTVTEIYDYLRLLFARVGHPHCPVCGREISNQSVEQIVEKVTEILKGRFMILSPIVKDRKGEFSALFENIKAQGFKKVRVDGQVKDLDEDFVLIKTNKHNVDVVIDRIVVTPKDLKNKIFKDNLKTRLTDSIEQSLKLSDGLVVVSQVLDKSYDFPEFPKTFNDHLFSEKFACPVDNIELPEIEPRLFSFNTPHGACPRCTGIGKVMEVNPKAVFSDEISILEGGILPFSTIFEHDTWYAKLIKTVCSENGIDSKKPLGQIDESKKNLLINGTGDRIYQVYGENRHGRLTSINEKFDGIKKNLEKRYHETDSDYTKMAIERYMYQAVCPACLGARLKKESLGITIDSKSISDVTSLTIDESANWIKKIKNTLSEKEKNIGDLILKEIESRLNFLKDVGLEYLTLGREAASLAGGEAQRIRLASQIGSGLTGVLYVLDEPTIGLHPRDNGRLIKTLKKLRDLGNTVLVVEHDKEMMEVCDYLVDFGPGAGKWGGVVVSQGTIEKVKKDKNSQTGKFLSGKKDINIPNPPSEFFKEGQFLHLIGASQFNLKNITVDFPLGKLIAITGVSGSGKSTLIVDTLYHAVAQKINREHKEISGAFQRVEGIENLNKVILMDQSPIGRTPRSNPATYTKIFDLIRKIYEGTKESRMRGYNVGRFSFNVKGGRCEACEGQGQIKIEMQFMPDIWVTCDVCHGARYNSQTLDIVYKGKNISEVLSFTVSEAKEFFHAHIPIVTKLETLEEVGLNYMELGQSATTLSGGEAQRVKLASELGKRSTGRTLYILDEPTTGLHFLDLEKLLKILKLLVSKGNTVIVIEHNLDIVKNADWVIDLGPEGGNKGGEIIAEGSPRELAKVSNSFTGKYLKQYIKLH